MEKQNSKIPPRKAWRFFRAGGFDQVRLDSAHDLLALDSLDQKLWVALACPIENVYFDKRVLSLLDFDKDGRIRANDIIHALQWVGRLLVNPEDLIRGIDGISITDIADTTDEGTTIRAAIKRSLAALGKSESDRISIDEIRSLEKVLSEKAFNGDGIIGENATDDAYLVKCIQDIMATMGTDKDRSGNPGIDAQRVNDFFTKATAYTTWVGTGDNDSISILGKGTVEAAETILAVREKIDDYFIRCSIANYDANAIALLNGSDDDFSLIGKNMVTGSSDLERLPVARVGPQQQLSLTEGINPAWESRITAFLKLAVVPVMGECTSFDKAAWDKLQKAFIPWFRWRAENPAPELDAIGSLKVAEYCSSTAWSDILTLIEKDASEAVTFNAIVDLEKCASFQRDLYRLCTNFVNFKDFYATNRSAIFQAGTLYIDQRSCSLCVKIDDVGKHSTIAAMAGTCLAYCECRRTAETAKFMIVAAITGGDSENLIVGRNGIFYDRDGKDWDATVVKIIENPISMRQAFWLPYKNLVRMIEAQVAKRAAAADAKSTGQLSTIAEATVNSDQKSILPSTQPPKVDVGTVAALGVAVGAIGTFLATFFGYAAGIVKLGPLAVVGALIGVLLIISGPSVILAYIKLRKRNLGPVLDANGWAINAKARISVPFGEMLTRGAVLPPGSKRDLHDPYAEKKSPWIRLVIIALIAYLAYRSLDHFGLINEWTHGKAGKATVAPAGQQKAK